MNRLNKNDIITTDRYLDFCNINNICYIKTDFFYHGYINWRGSLHPTNIKNIFVAGHSDYPITDQISCKYSKIFCINKDTNNTNVYGLPLGITNYCDDSPLHKIYGNLDIMVEIFEQNIKKDNLLYMNFNINTYLEERKLVFGKFKNENYVKIGNIDKTLESRKIYLQNIKASKFVLCPRGNGIDTHRLWETLYMGSIPIVKYHDTYHLVKDLPIIFINDWDEITESFLNKKYEEMSKKEWNYDKLKISYWTNFIKENIS